MGNFLNAFMWTCNSKKSKEQKMLMYRHTLAFNNAFFQAMNIACQRYHIKGLPDTIRESDIKSYLINTGSAILFSKNGSWFCLPGKGYENLNINGFPKNAWIHGMNGFAESVNLHIPGGKTSSFIRKGFGDTVMPDTDKAFLIRENYFMYPFIRHIEWLANAIADSMETLETTRENIKAPYLFGVDESMKTTVEEELKEARKNNTHVISSGSLNTKRDIQFFPLQVPIECLNSTADIIEWYWNWFYGLCGFNSNANPDKKAQISVEEVNSNNESILAMAASTINCLKDDFEDFNNNSDAPFKLEVEKTDFSEYTQKVERSEDYVDNGRGRTAEDLRGDSGRETD